MLHQYIFFIPSNTIQEKKKEVIETDTFQMKTEIKCAQGALEVLGGLPFRKILIITDPFLVTSGMIEQVTRHLGDREVRVFSEIVPDPPVETVVAGIGAVEEHRPEAIIAVGGGSAIDAAKAIMHFSRPITGLGSIFFIAIPTTSGTGSEVTSFAVITDQEKGVKYPLVSDALLPDLAILDVSLVKSVPTNVAADTGMDVLTHAIEAFVSTKATDFTDALAAKAAGMVFAYLRRSWQSGEDTEAREKMHIASCMAGIAFNAASLGLNHAMAHNMGGTLKIPHGRINALLLPLVIEFNSGITGYKLQSPSKAAKKYEKLAKYLGISGGNTLTYVKNFVYEIRKLLKDLQMPETLREMGIKGETVSAVEEKISRGAMEDVCLKTNPRLVEQEDVVRILRAAL